MGEREDFLALFDYFTVQRREHVTPVPEHLKKEHEEMMKLLNSEEALNRELTKRMFR